MGAADGGMPRLNILFSWLEGGVLGLVCWRVTFDSISILKPCLGGQGVGPQRFHQGPCFRGSCTGTISHTLCRGFRETDVALILKRNLVGPGFVEGKLLHVQGNGRRKLGYMLTPTGYRVVQGKYF